MSGKKLILGLKQHYADKENYKLSDVCDVTLLDLLSCEDIVHEERASEHRWYDLWDVVVKVGDRYICYVRVEVSGEEMDDSDAGYDTSVKIDWLQEYVQKEVTKIEYVPKEDK